MSKITATAKMLENLAIMPDGSITPLGGSNYAAYFDKLINVEWLSGPHKGQKGLVLFSHYCQWPESLSPYADFLEGCFTPPEVSEDSRLVLGNHPQTVTSYEWDGDWQNAIINISTHEAEPLMDYYQSRTYQRTSGTLPTSRGFRLLMRVYSRFAEEGHEAGLEEHQVFSAFEQRYLNQEHGLERFTPNLWSFIYLRARPYGVIPTPELSPVVWGPHLEVGEVTKVISSSPEEGFALAEQLPYTYNTHHNVLNVTDTQIGGWAPAWSMPLQSWPNFWVVNLPKSTASAYAEAGWAEAVDLPD